MSEPTQLDHQTLAVEIWTSIFKDQGALRPRLGALVQAVIRQMQDLEYALWSLIYDRLLASAKGDALDLVGTLVGENRQGAEDYEYRRFIQARIRTNITGGMPDDLLWILQTITGASDVLLLQAWPADVTLDYFVDEPLSDRQKERVANHMLDSVAAGVSINIVEAVLPKPFGFIGAPNAHGYGEGVYGSGVLSEG